ncbi:hypothetical protein [Candidatus Symbiopectobacterium sp.]|uniref:hypothetical protein n=1 Tax=Candidatus Symbiopectobacterium sp. TaxID=2816440 RepID=UPI0025BD3E17|nr:hypothetical protein [Candidatus Symbiopectobacterium sp.]
MADFEEWFRFHCDVGESELLLPRANGGANYSYPETDLVWIAWQASLAALVVNIEQHNEFEINHIASPEPEKDTYAIGWIDGRNYAAKQVRAAGITVKEG